MDTMKLPTAADDQAPDGSEIRLLPSTPAGGLCHCVLPAGGISHAVRHKTVEEIWYFLEGSGEVWRRYGATERVDPVGPGTALTIPYRTMFQFRNTGTGPLVFVIVTLPAWPGPDEAVPVTGKWSEHETAPAVRQDLHPAAEPVQELRDSPSVAPLG